MCPADRSDDRHHLSPLSDPAAFYTFLQFSAQPLRLGIFFPELGRAGTKQHSGENLSSSFYYLRNTPN